jgi:hypothetical protein
MLPGSWERRLVDLTVQPLKPADLEVKLEAAFLALTFILFQVVGSHQRSNARKLR